MGGDQQYHVCVQTNLGMHSVNTVGAMTTVPNRGLLHGMDWERFMLCRHVVHKVAHAYILGNFRGA